MENLHTITHTVDGYPIKDLTWIPRDGLLRGLVKDPIRGRETLHNGYIGCTWKPNGSLTTKYGGTSRTDLYLTIKRNEH